MTTKPESPDSGASDRKETHWCVECGGITEPCQRLAREFYSARPISPVVQSAGDQAVAWNDPRMRKAIREAAPSVSGDLLDHVLSRAFDAMPPLYTRAQDAAGKGVEELPPAPADETEAELVARLRRETAIFRAGKNAKPVQVGQKVGSLVVRGRCRFAIDFDLADKLPDGEYTVTATPIGAVVPAQEGDR